MGLGESNKYKVAGIKIDGGDVCRLIMVLLEHLSEVQCGLDVVLQARHMDVLHLTVGKILDLGDNGRSRTSTLTGPVHVTVGFLTILGLGAS